MKILKRSKKKVKLTPDDVKFVMNAIRQASVKWKGRARALRRARKRVFVRYSKNGKAIYKFHWQCSSCRKWHRDVQQVEVDHIHEIGGFCGDWNKTLLRMLPSILGLQVLCVVCHMKKTNAYNAAHLKWKRKARPLE